MQIENRVQQKEFFFAITKQMFHITKWQILCLC